MRKLSYLTICVAFGLFAGCGGDSSKSTPDDKVDSKQNANVTTEDGKPPQRDKIPSDDLFATMVQAFVENQGDQYEKADRQLDKLGVDGIPTYVDALQGGDAESRKLACMKLANLGPDAAPATDALASVLNDDDPSVRANAASVLSIVPQPPDNLVNALRAILKDESGTMWHGMSIVALSNLGTLAADVVPDLVPFLTSEDAELRRNAVRTLRAIGPAAKPFIPDIKKLEEDQDEAVRTSAKDAVAFLESIDREADGTDRPTEKVGQADTSDSAGSGDTGPPPLIPELNIPEPDPPTESEDEKGKSNELDSKPPTDLPVDN